MNGRMERELPYTADDIALLNAMHISPKDKPVYRSKWRGFLWGMSISTALWVILIECVIWAYRWYR